MHLDQQNFVYKTIYVYNAQWHFYSVKFCCLITAHVSQSILTLRHSWVSWLDQFLSRTDCSRSKM